MLRKELYLSHPVVSAHVRAEVKLKVDSWTLVVRPAARVRIGSFFGSSFVRHDVSQEAEES